MKKHQQESLKIRYLFKLATKFIGIPIGFLTAAIVPRGLGVINYGNFNFITDFFIRLTGLFDLSTSAGFYTKLSQRPEESTLVRFYWGFVAIMVFLMVLFVMIIFMINKQGSIWINQQAVFIWLGLIWGILYWINQVVAKVVDAYGVTVKGELAVIKKQLVGICFLGLLFIIGKFSLLTFFIYHFILLALMLFLWWKVLNKYGISLFPRGRLNNIIIKNYSSEFYHFSMPLFVGGLLGFFLGFADRWLLQYFGGSVEQGLYSLSFKVAALCFLFTKSMTPLFHREISRAYGKTDLIEMRRLFIRFVPMLFSIAVSICAFFFFQADKVTAIIGGDTFKNATMSVALMSFYPVHQTYGQLNSAVYFATGRTKLYRNVGLVVAIFGLIVTYLFLAPNEQFGLNLGSNGLALKMVLVQIIGQNIRLWFNARFLNISFTKLLGHQLLSILIIGCAAGLSTHVFNSVIDNIYLSVTLSGGFYILLIVGILYFYPRLFSTTRDEIIRNIKMLNSSKFFSLKD